MPNHVPTYVLLMKWTDEGGLPSPDELERQFPADGGDAQGASMFKERHDTIVSALDGVKKGKLVNLLWTLGEHDMVAIIEAESNEEIGGFALFLSGEHGVRTQTMPAFQPTSMNLIGEVAARCGRSVREAAGPG
jgi:uncharacterized protein with GYD domain